MRILATLLPASSCAEVAIAELLRRHHLAAARTLLALSRHLLELRLEPALEHAVDLVEIDVDHRADVERQELRKHKPADHGDAERLAQLSAGAGAKSDGQRAEDRGE